MRRLVVLLAPVCLSCAAIIGVSEFEEADCVRDCGAADAKPDSAPPDGDAKPDG
jgi:hypothetical protein